VFRCTAIARPACRGEPLRVAAVPPSKRPDPDICSRRGFPLTFATISRRNPRAIHGHPVDCFSRVRVGGLAAYVRACARARVHEPPLTRARDNNTCTGNRAHVNSTRDRQGRWPGRMLSVVHITVHGVTGGQSTRARARARARTVFVDKPNPYDVSYGPRRVSISTERQSLRGFSLLSFTSCFRARTERDPCAGRDADDGFENASRSHELSVVTRVLSSSGLRSIAGRTKRLNSKIPVRTTRRLVTRFLVLRALQ